MTSWPPPILGLAFSQDFSCLLNAFTQLTVRDPPFFDTAPTVMLGILGTFSPQHLSLTAHAYAKQQVRTSVPLIFSVGKQPMPATPNMSSNFIISLIDGSAALPLCLEVRHEALFDKVADLSLRLLDRFTPLNLANLAYGYGRLQVQHQELVKALADEAGCLGGLGGWGWPVGGIQPKMKGGQSWCWATVVVLGASHVFLDVLESTS